VGTGLVTVRLDRNAAGSRQCDIGGRLAPQAREPKLAFGGWLGLAIEWK